MTTDESHTDTRGAATKRSTTPAGRRSIRATAVPSSRQAASVDAAPSGEVRKVALADNRIHLLLRSADGIGTVVVRAR